jgi:hypothetical protein
MVDKFGIPQVIEMTLINPRKFKIKNKKTNRNYPIIGLDFKNRKRGKEIHINTLNLKNYSIEEDSPCINIVINIKSDF